MKSGYHDDEDTSRQNKRRKRKTSSKEGDLAICTPALKQHMMELIQNIMRKDIHMIFAEPVNDVIAPGYSSIISHPMDLSTMQAKVQRGEYTTLRELKEDADLMCTNCMVYNAEFTIFYKEAVKIQNYINSLFGERRTKAALSSHVQEGIRKKNELQDEWRAEEIRASVSKAAREAKERLDRLAPGTRVGYLSKEGGVTLLNIVNAPAGEPTEKVVDLSCLESQDNTPTSLLNNFKEKRRVPGKPVQYLNYGPFGSFMPTYDSVFSNLDKPDQELLFRCYGDELGLSYCRSVQEFARGSADSLRAPVDNIIDCLTKGGHAKANKLLAQKYVKIIRDRRLRQRKLLENKSPGTQSPLSSENSCTLDPGKVASDKEERIKTEEDSLLNLLESDDIPDILNNPDLLERLETVCQDEQLQEKLDSTGHLISELYQEQMGRLSNPTPSSNDSKPSSNDSKPNSNDSKPGPNYSKPDPNDSKPGPNDSKPDKRTSEWPTPVGDTEQDIAAAVREKLGDMIGNHVTPQEVISQLAVRNHMSSDLLDNVKHCP